MTGKDASTDPTRPLSKETGPRERIGPYTLLEKIGEGGMGEVWLAEQKTPVRRRVALKLIKPGMDSARVIARFEAERQALALMSHPNIAQVMDAGTTDGGRLYFVMEHVEGVPIVKHCDLHRLTTQERLELFVDVCEGLQHAHQKGIIHRDIKPSNILVTVSGARRIPKLIDFGVAKATAQKLTERTVYTELGQLIGTPEYMSPEQAEMTAEDVDTRSDIYSLGVLLYELLVGALPFDAKELRGASFDELRRKIREDDPPKPSTRIVTLGDSGRTSAEARSTDPRALRKRLRGDLDWITMKALAKDRTRRYGSAAEFADDVRRHLRHEPVEAGPPNLTYRTGRFVRRHRVGVVLAGVALAVLVAIGFREHVQGLRVAEERDEAVWRGYVLSVQAAVHAAEAGRFDLARTHLAECPPGSRGWEWSMVDGTLPAPPRRTDVADSPVRALRLTADGSELRLLYQKSRSTRLGRRSSRDFDASGDWTVATVLDVPYTPSAVVYWNKLVMDPSGSTAAVCDTEGNRLDVVTIEGGTAQPLWSRAMDCWRRLEFAGGNRFLVVREGLRSGATAQERKTPIKVFDVSSGAIVAELPTAAVAGASERPVVAVLDDETLALRDLDTGRITDSIPWSMGSPETFVLTSQADRAFLGFEQGLLLTADFAEREITRLETDTLGSVDVLAASPDGRLLAFGTSEGVVGVIEQGNPPRLLHRMGSGIQGLALTPDGSALFALDTSGALVSLPLAVGDEAGFRRGTRGHRLSRSGMEVRIGRAGELIAAVTWDEEGVVLIDGKSLRVLEQLYPGAATGVKFGSSLHWSEDGRRLLAYPLWNTATERKGIRGWNVDASGHAVPSFAVPEDDTVYTMLLGVASNTRSWLRATHDDAIVSERADADGVHALWQLPSGSLEGSPAAAVPDDRRGRWIVRVKDFGLVSLSAEDGTILARAPLGAATPHVLDPSGALLLVKLDGTGLGVVDAETLRLIDSHAWPDREIEDVRFTPDGSRFVVGFRDGTIEVWSTDRRQLVVTLEGPAGATLSALDVAADGRMLVAYSEWLEALGAWGEANAESRD